MKYTVTVAGRSLTVEADPRGGLAVDGAAMAAEIALSDRGRAASVIVDGHVHEVLVLSRAPLRLQVDGIEVTVGVVDERAALAARARGSVVRVREEIRAPMPGLLKTVHVSEGDIVEAGAPLVTLEAMKMENELRAPARARVARVAGAAGTKIERGALLLVLEQAP